MPTFTVRGELPAIHPSRFGRYIVDPEGLFPGCYEIARFWRGSCKIKFKSLHELGFPHTALTPEIYEQARVQGGSPVPFGAALRLVHQHPFLLDTLQMKSCLIGINRVPGELKGNHYVVELSQEIFRFRRADDPIRWSVAEIWGFDFS
jgi:hypothetical protein